MFLVSGKRRRMFSMSGGRSNELDTVASIGASEFALKVRSSAPVMSRVSCLWQEAENVLYERRQIQRTRYRRVDWRKRVRAESSFICSCNEQRCRREELRPIALKEPGRGGPQRNNEFKLLGCKKRAKIIDDRSLIGRLR